eukprot:TRINITY_DN23790_c0_g1_i1.p1 TRINITY_DN23790_c0_g1~~TRINITY_DN23790_c0_g1_i1.p1  ORF type:complete len:174 (+),score=34.36 TRINITY_DN23790_c0_g1_i1:443-964(+)
MIGTEENKSVFVVVGTTSFDALIQAVDTVEFRAVLRQKGYTSLIIQIGRGKHIPAKVDPLEGVTVEHFTFKPSLANYVRSASLVVSHAGSGSIFEALRAKKPLVVVVNEALMDNHQQELAGALAARGHLRCASPLTLSSVLADLDTTELLPYPPAEAESFARALDSFLGFPDL